MTAWWITNFRDSSSRGKSIYQPIPGLVPWYPQQEINMQMYWPRDLPACKYAQQDVHCVLGQNLFKSYSISALQSHWNTMCVTTRTPFQTSCTINRNPEGSPSEAPGKASGRALRAPSQHRFTSFVCPCWLTGVTPPRLYCLLCKHSSL